MRSSPYFKLAKPVAVMDLISDPANLPTFLEEPKFQRKIAFPHLMQTRLDKYYVFICFLYQIIDITLQNS